MTLLALHKYQNETVEEKIEKIADKRALLEEFVIKNQNGLYRLAYSYCKNQDDALDMVQEAVLSAWQAIPALENMEYLKTWFYRILINKSLTHLQKAKRLPILADDDLMSRQAYPDNADNRESIYDLYGGLDLLPPKLRTVIFLRYFEDMKLKDISLVLQEPESTVKSRLYKALTALREIMENDKGGLANE